LNTSDDEVWAGGPAPGAPALDAPVLAKSAPWLLNHLGHRLVALHFTEHASAVEPFAIDGVETVVVARQGQASRATTLIDPDGTVFRRYAAHDGTVYLIRPDQHVAARFGTASMAAVERARDRALGLVHDQQPRRAAGA